MKVSKFVGAVLLVGMLVGVLSGSRANAQPPAYNHIPAQNLTIGTGGFGGVSLSLDGYAAAGGFVNFPWAPPTSFYSTVGLQVADNTSFGFLESIGETLQFANATDDFEVTSTGIVGIEDSVYIGAGGDVLNTGILVLQDSAVAGFGTVEMSADSSAWNTTFADNSSVVFESGATATGCFFIDPTSSIAATTYKLDDLESSTFMDSNVGIELKASGVHTLRCYFDGNGNDIWYTGSGTCIILVDPFFDWPTVATAPGAGNVFVLPL